MANLVNGLGGTAGFGELFLGENDDGSTGDIDLTSVFGPSGLNFYGTYYTSFYVNNNGNITFDSALSTYTPFGIPGAASPIIAPYFADVDTRGDESLWSATPGGTSLGTDLVWIDLDDVNGIVTITWDDVGFYESNLDLRSAFQLQLIDRSDRAVGDFDIRFLYEDIQWTTGDASNGSGGFGGTPARAGFSAGDGVNYYELAASGSESGLLALPDTVGVGGSEAGEFLFSITSGTTTFVEAADDIIDVPANTGLQSGSVFADNGFGVDADSDGDGFVVTAVNGVAAYVGQPIYLLPGAELVLNADGTFTYDVGTIDLPHGATIGTVTYEITDLDEGDTDTATITFRSYAPVEGPAEICGDTGTLPVTGQDVGFQLELPDYSNFDTATATGLITSGSVANGAGSDLNIAVVVDISGSVGGTFSGAYAVGDVNGDGLSNTVLDAEILGIEALVGSLLAEGLDDANLALVSFDSSSRIDYTGKLSEDLDGNGRVDIVDAAYALRDTGTTSFEGALSQTINFFSSSAAPGTGGNHVFFMSDGNPNSTTAWQDEAATLYDPSGINADIRAFGVGSGASEVALDLLDDGIDNNSATIVLDPSTLDAALTSSGVDPATVLGVEI